MGLYLLKVGAVEIHGFPSPIGPITQFVSAVRVSFLLTFPLLANPGSATPDAAIALTASEIWFFCPQRPVAAAHAAVNTRRLSIVQILCWLKISTAFSNPYRPGNSNASKGFGIKHLLGASKARPILGRQQNSARSLNRHD